MRFMEIEDILFRTTGRARRTVTAEVVGELTIEELSMLSEEKGSEPSALKRLSQRHHSLARILASGAAPGQAAVLCGYTNSRVSILLEDPAFRELLEFYKSGVEEKYYDLHEQLAGIAGDAAMELQERLEIEPEKLSVGQLIELTKMGADRTGHGPTKDVGQVVNNNFVVALPTPAASTDEWLNSRSTRVIEQK